MNNLPLTDHLAASNEPELVRAPATRHVAVLGAGAPGTDEFYRKKTLIGNIARALDGTDQSPVIEIQYWYPDGSVPVGIADFYSVNPVPSLLYRVMARISDDVTEEQIAAVRSDVTSPTGGPGDDVALFAQPEHVVVQVMHHGPFGEEFETLARLGAFADSRGVARSGPHHELHLDGFTRETPQDHLRTILRDPVA